MSTNLAPSNPQPTTVSPVRHQRTYLITETAVQNLKERAKNLPSFDDDERLADMLDEMVATAVTAGKIEEIVDNGEPARLVHIGEGNDLYFALVKKSTNRKTFSHAVVTVFSPGQVDNLKSNKWSSTPFKVGGLSETQKEKLKEVRPTVVAPANDPPIRRIAPTEKRSYLIRYMPARRNEQATYEHEEYSTPDEIETRLREIKAIPGSVRVFKELELAYKVVE
jgi:hypothetical protein